MGGGGSSCGAEVSVVDDGEERQVVAERGRGGRAGAESQAACGRRAGRAEVSEAVAQQFERSGRAGGA